MKKLTMRKSLCLVALSLFMGVSSSYSREAEAVSKVDDSYKEVDGVTIKNIFEKYTKEIEPLKNGGDQKYSLIKT